MRLFRQQVGGRWYVCWEIDGKYTVVDSVTMLYLQGSEPWGDLINRLKQGEGQPATPADAPQEPAVHKAARKRSAKQPAEA
jgi:hypothetical protein